jgi:preprotein translocase subunit SecY
MSCDLARRIGITLGAVLVYPIGAYLPLPGVAASAWVQSLWPECVLCLY